MESSSGYGKRNSVFLGVGIFLTILSIMTRASNSGIDAIIGIPMIDLGITCITTSLFIEGMRFFKHGPIKKILMPEKESIVN